MFRHLLEKLFGIEADELIITDIDPITQDPCSRYIERSSSELYLVLGRSCISDNVVTSAAITPETGAIKYCRV